MTTEEIEKGNKLIAEFMEYKLNDAEYPNSPFYETKEGDFINYPDCLNFHLSWDWLMPVVDKIYSMSFNENHGFTIDGVLFMECDINLIYKKIVGFINWYNQNK